MLRVLLLILRSVMRGSWRRYRGIRPAVGRRSLRRHRLDPSLVVSVTGDVEGGGYVLDGVGGVGLIVG